MAGVSVVTGAFGYTGRHIARHLLDAGEQVVTLTGHPERPNPFGDRLKVFPLDFGHPQRLVEAMGGASTLYNTYWIRFERGPATFERTVANSRTLFATAREAGVRRVVHISITNPPEDSPLPYFRGKALVERALVASGLSYAIIRPTVVFGEGDILINNIAWLLRKFPVFPLFGRGDYRLQPVFVGDVAEMAVRAGGSTADTVVDAAGPETFTFEELVRLVARAVGSRARLVHLPPAAGFVLGSVVGLMVGDVLLTRDEIRGLMMNLLVSDGPPTGRVQFTDWLAQHARRVGLRYASELARHYR
ncbi:MAG: NAD-dependent epimerase/dehydratase family protein [Bacillota bacterium]